MNFKIIKKMKLSDKIYIIILIALSIILFPICWVYIYNPTNIIPFLITIFSIVFFWIYPILKIKNLNDCYVFSIGDVIFLIERNNDFPKGKIIENLKIEEVSENLIKLVMQEDLGYFSFNREEFHPRTIVTFKDKVFYKNKRVWGKASKDKKVEIDLNSINLVSLVSHELGHLFLFQFSEEEAHVKMAKLKF